MWLSEAHADIPINLMGPNPGPGHGVMSFANPSKPTFSMAWRHNRNAKNAQSRAQGRKSGEPASGKASVEHFSSVCSTPQRTYVRPYQRNIPDTDPHERATRCVKGVEGVVTATVAC